MKSRTVLYLPIYRVILIIIAVVSQHLYHCNYFFSTIATTVILFCSSVIIYSRVLVREKHMRTFNYSPICVSGITKNRIKCEEIVCYSKLSVVCKLKWLLAFVSGLVLHVKCIFCAVDGVESNQSRWCRPSKVDMCVLYVRVCIIIKPFQVVLSNIPAKKCSESSCNCFNSQFLSV